MNKNRKKLLDLIFTALLAALICAAAPFSIPVGAVPLSLATLAVYIAASVIDWKHGVAAVALYVLLGAVGLPVFAGFTGGVQRLVGMTGGYIFGYIPCALVTGLIIDRYADKKLIWPAAMLAGTVCCYAFGTAWFCVVSGMNLWRALSVCVLPFLPGDALKIVLATAVGIPVRRAVARILRKS